MVRISPEAAAIAAVKKQIELSNTRIIKEQARLKAAVETLKYLESGQYRELEPDKAP